MNDDLTRGKLNRMLKYFRNKKVSYRYEYNDSMGGHKVREGVINYDSFAISGSGFYFYAILRNK